MESPTKRDLTDLIELINRATPDSLNIAKSILNKHPELEAPTLPILRECVDRSLNDKANRQLSEEVRAIKMEIIETLTERYSQQVKVTI